MPPTVEMVLPSLIAAGMEMVTVRLALGLRERGWRVGVTCLQEEGELAAELRSCGIRVAVVHEPGFSGNLRPRTLTPWLNRVRPDVVHVHSGAWIKGTHAARRAGVGRVVFTEHGLLAREPWYSGLLKRWGASYTDRVVAVSVPLREHLQSVGVPATKLVVIVNGVDVETFTPRRRSGSLRRELGIGEAPLIGHVARLAPEKNQALLLAAFREVRAQIPEARLALIGDGPLRAALEAQSRSSGVADYVHFLGVRRNMPDVYPEFDVFVLPSLAEGTSMSVLEAMASGCAIVATSVGGTPGLLDGGTAGDLVPAADEGALTRALTRLLGDPARRQQLGAAARARAIDAFSEARMVDAYIAQYGEPAGALHTRETDPCAA